MLPQCFDCCWRYFCCCRCCCLGRRRRRRRRGCSRRRWRCVFVVVFLLPVQILFLVAPLAALCPNAQADKYTQSRSLTPTAALWLRLVYNRRSYPAFGAPFWLELTVRSLGLVD